MDVLKEYGILVDLKLDTLKFKLKEEKVHLKMTPRKVVFKTKQIKAYFDYLRKGRAIVKAQTNALEEEDVTLENFEHSCF